MNLYSIFKKHPYICTDSRNCPENSIFFALRGDKFDANLFAAKALQNGCAYAVVDNAQVVADERYILVDNVLEALQNLAKEHRKRLGTSIIAITGTNGKTTTKELIANVLQEKFKILFTQGNLNNHIGVPLTLLQLNELHDMAVVEMGANHPGEIELLSNIVCPDFGIITNVGKAHLEGFGSFEGVMKTKAELYKYIFEHQGKLFVNNGNNFLTKMLKDTGFELSDSRIIPYNLLDKPALIQGEIISSSPFVAIRCTNQAGQFDIHTQLIGDYNAENILAAVAIGTYFGLSNELIQSGLESYGPKNNRSQLLQTAHNTLIVDAYNANPSSLKAAIQNFKTLKADRKVAIVGDMLELGEYSTDEHKAVIDELKKSSFDQIILVGLNFVASQSDFLSFAQVDELRTYLAENPIRDSYILIKGSRGIKLEKLIEIL